MPKQSIYPILQLAQNSDILFLTETWLLSPTRFKSTWKEYHTYGLPLTTSRGRQGHLGLALLVNPRCDFPVCQIEHSHPLLAKHTLSIVLSSTVLIHCIYIPPELEEDVPITAILDELPMQYASTTTTILCGDFNARLGQTTGDTRLDPRGRVFSNWIQTQNLTLWNQRLTYGQPTSYTFQGTSIIDFFLSDTDLVSPSLTIRHDLSLSSNHKFMTFSFGLPMSVNTVYPHSVLPGILVNLNFLKTEILTGTSAAYEYIDDIHQQLRDAIYNSLDAVCGRQPPSTDDWLKDFWTPEMTSVFNRKEYYYKKWRRAHGLNALRQWVLHQEAQAKLRRLILKRRRETWRQFCDQMAQGEYSKAIAKFSRIRKNRTIKPTFSTFEGPQHAADTMAQHLERIFAGDLLRNSTHTTTSTDAAPVVPELFDVASCSITIDDVNEAIKSLPRKKAPGVDHLTIEMLAPLTEILTPILVYLFQLCWRWSYTPLSWRVAQVIPIHKKGQITDPGNFRPISLTSIFRKILEKCLYIDLLGQSPTLDIAQGGFREARSTLDQALCLAEICAILRKHYDINPTLAFLDIKSAYDTVNRDHVWQTLSPCVHPALLGLLKNIFNDVQIEVLLGNTKSSRFSPKTGVLQGSILSPFLYSIYINQLPSLLRDRPLDPVPDAEPVMFASSINCLLYADDVVLIASPSRLQTLLQQCEEHSYQLGYCWNPLKCAIVAPAEDTQSYSLYNTAIPRQDSFPYLGIPIRPGGYINTSELIQGNINKALKTMNQMTAIGVNSTGFDRLLSARFYCQIVRPQLEYGLAISAVKYREFQQLESCQNQCLRRIFGGSRRSSVKVMLHLINQPTMKERTHILQMKFLLRSLNVPDDTLLSQLLPYIRTSASGSQWYKLTTSPLWRLCTVQDVEQIDKRRFQAIRQEYLQNSLEQRR
ncbi:hypothetical protein G6F53_006656 [Rhizopus delemar]|nr:hypothetical protein G6F53_006656 [Rhizopus delemar]